MISSLLVRLLAPAAAIGAALYAESQGLGLLRWLGVNGLVGGVLAVLLLDLLILIKTIRLVSGARGSLPVESSPARISDDGRTLRGERLARDD